MIIFIVYLAILFIFTLFSYILTDPNLVMSTHPLYWNFQVYMWETFYSQSRFITASYIFIVFALFILYFWTYTYFKKKKIIFKFDLKSIYLWAYGVILVPLTLSYNALSHDIFNYMFNVRMITKYGIDPHKMRVLDFVGRDDWTRFIHNLETYSPYGYGWTAIALIPSYLGMEKFLPTYVLFKLLTLVGLVIIYFGLQHLSQTLRNRNLYIHELVLLFLNPLFLLEALSSHHNDFWMMVPAVWAVSMIIRFMQPRIFNKSTKYKILYFTAASLLLTFSILIKLVTIVLIPLFVFAFVFVFFLRNYTGAIKKRFKLPIPTDFLVNGLLHLTKWVQPFIPTLISVVLFLPLFTTRSKWFLPWYLLWIIVWIPFVKSKFIRNLIIVFTFSSLLRYVPWLYNSFEYSDEILRNQRLVTWVIPIVYLFTNIKSNFKTNVKYTSTNLKKLGRM